MVWAAVDRDADRHGRRRHVQQCQAGQLRESGVERGKREQLALNIVRHRLRRLLVVEQRFQVFDVVGKLLSLLVELFGQLADGFEQQRHLRNRRINLGSRQLLGGLVLGDLRIDVVV